MISSEGIWSNANATDTNTEISQWSERLPSISKGRRRSVDKPSRPAGPSGRRRSTSGVKSPSPEAFDEVASKWIKEKSVTDIRRARLHLAQINEDPVAVQAANQAAFDMQTIYNKFKAELR